MTKTAIKHDWTNGTRYKVTRHDDQRETWDIGPVIDDERGRACGFKKILTPCTCRKLDADEDPSYSFRFADPDLPGQIWYAVTQATRDGQAFGASQSGRYFTDRHQAEIYMAQRVARGITRYIKKYDR